MKYAMIAFLLLIGCNKKAEIPSITLSVRVCARGAAGGWNDTCKDYYFYKTFYHIGYTEWKREGKFLNVYLGKEIVGQFPENDVYAISSSCFSNCPKVAP